MSETMVTLARYAKRSRADSVARQLRELGIDAIVVEVEESKDDLRRGLGSGGVQVKVPENSLEGARHALETLHVIFDKEVTTSAGLRCLRCEGEMNHVGDRRYHHGMRWGLLGNLAELFVATDKLMVYRCPNCGKIEFFSKRQ